MRKPNALSALAVVTALSVACAMLPIIGPWHGDIAQYLLPWMHEIHRLGWRSIAGGFSQYPPPYIYVLNLAAWIPNDIWAVKLANVPFIVLLAWGTGALAGRTAAAMALVLPSMLVNAFAFGQCDVIFVSFLVWFVVFAEREKPTLAAVMFGLALSFKAQAMFLAPVVLYLLLTRRMKLWHAALIPLTYAVMMAPAAVAGRPWSDLLTIYLHQESVFHFLTINSPNPWWFVSEWLDYRMGLLLGLVLGVSTALLISMRAARSNLPVLLAACISAALLPYVLPKMTSRYWFAADVLTLALAFRDPRTWPAAALIQIGSLVAMLSYFTETDTASFAFVPMTLGIGILTSFATSKSSKASAAWMRAPSTATDQSDLARS